MGLKLFSSSSDCNPCDESSYTLVPNPNPYRFFIEKCEYVNNCTVAMIKYVDCTTYNGLKVCVYENITPVDLVNQKYLDPHFVDDKKCIYPIARFTGNEEGFENALKFARTK